MALMERVATLMRANVNDLIDRAENPEKMLKQLVLDMENQLLQLKTQLAAAMAQANVMQRKLADHAKAEQAWRDRAGLAVKAGKDDMARTALGRAVEEQTMAAETKESWAKVTEDAEHMRATYGTLAGRLTTTRHRLTLLQEDLKRAQIAGRAMTARASVDESSLGLRQGKQIQMLKARVVQQDAVNAASRQMAEGEALEGEWLEETMQGMERDAKVELLLQELKQEQGMLEAG